MSNVIFVLTGLRKILSFDSSIVEQHKLFNSIFHGKPVFSRDHVPSVNAMGKDGVAAMFCLNFDVWIDNDGSLNVARGPIELGSN